MMSLKNMSKSQLFIATLPNDASLAYINSRCSSGDSYWDYNCEYHIIYAY